MSTSASHTAPAARFVRPHALLILGSGLLPLPGVLFWGWDAFLVMILYWTETGIVGFWTLVRGLLNPDPVNGVRPGIPARIATALFLIVHAGLFMAAHFAILWSEFAGPWAARALDWQSFFDVVIWGTGLWVAAGGLFLARAFDCLLDVADRVRLRRAILWAWPGYPGRLLTRPSPSAADLFAGFYGRIILMQVAVLVGGFIAVKLTGAATPILWPLILLVGLKTLVEMSLLARAPAEAA